MFGLGTTEILVILLVALLVLGPQKLPGIARSLGKTLGEFRRVSTEFQRTLNAEVEMAEQQKTRPSEADAVSTPQKPSVASASSAQNGETASHDGKTAPETASAQEHIRTAPYATQDTNKT